MKSTFTRILLPTCLFLLSNFCFAGSPYPGETLYEVLCNLNPQWEKVTPIEGFYHEKPTFTTSEEAIRLHFTLIEHTLRKRPTDHLTLDQKKRRNLHLDRLLEYRDSGAFPSNYDFDSPRPYFIDPVNQNVCAVGHLVTEDGHGDLAQTIFEEDNNGYVYDLDKTYPLTAWADANGMTLDELAWIQPQYQFSYWEGASLSYEHVSGCDYEVFVTTYQGCGGALGPIMNQTFRLRSMDGSCVDAVTTFNPVVLSETRISPICPGVVSKCDSQASNIPAIREIKLSKTLNLCSFQGCSKFELIYNNCFRPFGQGCFYSDSLIIDLQNFAGNSSPQLLSPFTSEIFLNNFSNTVTSSFAAMDPDGDSLSYEMGPCWVDSATLPTYQAGYGPNSPLGSDWSIYLDPVTGNIDYSPAQGAGMAMRQMCVWIKEWRNGQMISKTTHDVELNVIPIGNQPLPQINLLTNFQGANMVGNDIHACVGSQLSFDVSFVNTVQSTASMNLPGSEYYDPSNVNMRDTVGRNGRYQWTPTQKGIYFVNLIGWDNNCPYQGKTTRTYRIIVGDPFAINLNTTLTSCQEFTFNANLVGGGTGFTYTWSGDDGMSGNQASLVKSYSSPGWYDYELIVASPGGCHRVIRDSVYVPAVSAPVITRTGDFLLTDPATSYQWFLDGVPIAGATTGSHLATSCGVYTVEAVKHQCTFMSLPMQVQLTNMPTASILPWGPTQFCEGDSVLLDAGSGYNSYLWSTGETTRTIIAKTDDLYTVTVTENGCEAVSSPFQVVVHPLPAPVITPMGNVLQSSPAATYQWNLDGVAIPNATGPSYTATQYGNYTVTVTDANTCEGTSDPVTAGNQTSIDDPIAGSFRLYPNPARDWVRLEIFNYAQNWNQILLSDLYGRTIESFNLGNCPNQCNPTLDLGDLRAGIYFIQLKGEKESQRLKFVKH